ncbi:hypothetical protein [Mesorhizobium sp.]|uniref:hypothetical protein n=1 Tax=Mesorhizobium sp. TaxID=1871066 RepID=UPI000FE71999|nr:hypothetical protein [Mesorhizobium sp.]RWP29079.1 MAG: hypothetical protein EOR02_17750 [Mesorhizobium sp.]
MFDRIRGVINSRPEDKRSFDQRLEDLQRFASDLTSDPNWLKKTELPRDSDFAFIGKFVQVYCSADLNARATINAMRFINKAEIADFAGSLNDTDVILHLNICASEWIGAPHIAEGVRKAASTLEMHRIHRHGFAHWVVRKVPGRNALVILTKNAKEAIRRDNSAQDREEAKFGIVQLSPLRHELDKLMGHSDYLGQLADYLEANRGLLRSEHSSQSSPAQL